MYGCSQNVGRKILVITGPFYFFYNLASHVGKEVLTSFHQDQWGQFAFNDLGSETDHLLM